MKPMPIYGPTLARSLQSCSNMQTTGGIGREEKLLFVGLPVSTSLFLIARCHFERIQVSGNAEPESLNSLPYTLNPILSARQKVSFSSSVAGPVS